MLLTTRSWALSQQDVPKRVREEKLAFKRAQKMLLIHQHGSVKVGEVIRYTVTYTPSADRILPTPSYLHVKVKNTEAIPFRAAYLHGPYTIHASAYPSTFNPNAKVEDPKRYGVPEYEPNVKPGASWNARLTVPEEIRESGSNAQREDDGKPRSATWIIEIASQILFSKTASIGFDVLVARDERSLELGFASLAGKAKSAPTSTQNGQGTKHRRGGSELQKGVYSKAVELVVEDTATLWNKPQLPEWDKESGRLDAEAKRKKQKRVHLIVLTHGLHSNIGADMLYLKESIDGSIREARESRRKRREDAKDVNTQGSDVSSEGRDDTPAPANLTGGQEDINQENKDDEDDEMVVVRGFNGNAIRTEKGIQYLGKRLAKHVLSITYPDQPFMPVKKTMAKKMSNALSPVNKSKPDEEGIPSHEGSSITHPRSKEELRAYKYTSISFIGHSLGGLVQTYAIAYIQKHSPGFFTTIQPANFICMASPLLGLSNENPTYVKFALDFGLVGRTGQDLGLTWRAPTLAKSGWSAMVGGFGANNQKDAQQDPGSKPLLRILPTGPAHHVLRMFRNRTVYSNVVNDGIVPLRTSCLLFLDWRGMERVDKARRENGLIGTVAEWGYAQLTGQNSSPHPGRQDMNSTATQAGNKSRDESPNVNEENTTVPQPDENTTNDDDTEQITKTTSGREPASHQFLKQQSQQQQGAGEGREPSPKKDSLLLNGANAVSRFLSFLQPSGAHTSKDNKMFHRSQTTLKPDPDDVSNSQQSAQSSDASNSNNRSTRGRPPATRGDSTMNEAAKHHGAPPKTTIFESAGDLINPPLPPTSWLIDPAARARTIFHDRVYHPEDIPPPPTKPRANRFGRSYSTDSAASDHTEGSTEGGGMKVEEKIARAYHKDLSWRKVLVRLEPDAHNNLIVRRIFANAYGWPVVKHLCDTHFADTHAAQTRDEHEAAFDRAKKTTEPVTEAGDEVEGQRDRQSPDRSTSEMREATDELAPLRDPERSSIKQGKINRQDSSLWDDSYFETSDDEDDSDADDRYALTRLLSPNPKNRSRPSTGSTGNPTSPGQQNDAGLGTSNEEIDDFLHAKSSPGLPMEGHRGLLPTPTRFTASSEQPKSPKTTTETANLQSSQSDQPESSTQDPESTPTTVTNAPLSQSPPPITPLSGNTTDVGLRKTVEDQMNTLDEAQSSAGKKRPRSSGSGVGEQVARLSMDGRRG